MLRKSHLLDVYEALGGGGGGVGGGGSQVALVVKNLPASAGDIRDMGWTSGSRRSPGRGNGN